ncbi:hypothetical protein [Streptomyces sp. NPDC048392]|uniref:hypothetical protein n=1 Tax=Streptomyces sp. NPDC048392 TaxID=3365543 RepID=UPI00371F50C6
MDWRKSSGESIGLALIRARATGEPDDRIGSPLFDFGGPGFATLPGLAPDHDKFRTRCDRVSFDPRGAGGSRGVCRPDTGLPDEDDADGTPDDGDAETRTLVEFLRKTAAACEQGSGDIHPYVGTTRRTSATV